MCIEDIYISFTKTMNRRSMSHRLTKKMIENQRKQVLLDYKELFENNELDTPIYTDYMLFYSWIKQSIIHYDQNDTTLNSLWNDITYYHNKLYQWQLVSAFEAYEKYLKSLIPFLNILEKIDKKGCSASKILARLRNLLPEYEELELHTIKETPQEIAAQPMMSDVIDETGEIRKEYREQFFKDSNNRFYLALIEKMRHCIVHNNGQIENKEEFLKETLESIGLFNNGNYEKEYQKIVESYFTISGYKNEITLLEIPLITGVGFDAATGVLDNLFQILLNSAYHIYRELKEKLTTNGGLFDV
jgi:hypothetical protein